MASSGYGLLVVQGVFLFTGVFSTCAAQFVFYQGAGAQKAMLLPLCNYLGMMLVGVIPSAGSSDTHHPRPSVLKAKKHDDDLAATALALALTESTMKRDDMELTRRQADKDASSTDVKVIGCDKMSPAPTLTMADLTAPSKQDNYSTCMGSLTVMQSLILLNILLDFGGCIFANIGLSMAGSGVFQVIYSSVVCWSALLSKIFLNKQPSQYEWLGIAIVTFGLAFSAMGQSNGGRNASYVLMGCVNTLIGAAFYGGNYVTGEFILMLPERPEPKDLCLKMGICCVSIISVYQMFWVLPQWTHIITEPVMQANGDPIRILGALFLYTVSQLAHGLTYFMMLGACGAVTTGIMQSLRAVCVFGLSSMLYCSHQESQCFDAKRGIATLFVVAGVLFYSWAKGEAKIQKPVDSTLKKMPLPHKNCIV
ncbi:hypothetical protein H310_04879 [Aphanomyces invadans]|uniref:EamA domain-containing protein n=1 Tax=Aphanomyces invadans TaxID=157072 RepID=A0A024UC30_9STRA|nr:hypothetical protein H310_04879 [Aphanomyces invadans]ETW03412.1 hypothetical protein H310_04879 [Aphanomyces invadans]|eukprot:XP_008867641.1 hypothetical protein H310_04879 [Aphanomyces invadans]